MFIILIFFKSPFTCKNLSASGCFGPWIPTRGFKAALSLLLCPHRDQKFLDPPL
jgi:hypothetical protein